MTEPTDPADGGPAPKGSAPVPGYGTSAIAPASTNSLTWPHSAE